MLRRALDDKSRIIFI